jgi:hypothetical protein
MKLWLALHFTSDHFGNRAIELAGRVVHPDRQRLGIGTKMLGDFLRAHPAEMLVTYTRNPAVLKMIGHFALAIYPLATDDELAAVAADMTYVTQADGISYHLDRYDEGGLFQDDDPADGVAATSPLSLKQAFPVLLNQRHALVVAARIKKDIQ